MKVKKNALLGVSALIAVVLVILFLRGINAPSYHDVDSPRPVLGNSDAAVKVVEFSDFQCPACRSASSYPQRLINDFGDSISFEYKHFPLSFHQYAFKAAEAAECANDQGEFWEYAHVLFQNQPELSVRNLKRYAKELGLDTSSFSACLGSDAKRAVVEGNLREGYAANIKGTPTFFVNGKMMGSFQYESIKSEIEKELNS